MKQCFPAYAEELPELMRALKTVVEERFNEAVPKAWEIVKTHWNFVERANELDEIVAKAGARLKAGEEPRRMYLKGAEAEMTVSNAAVPILRAASEEMRAKRLALEEKNRATYEGIARNRAVLERSQGQIDEILVDFQKAMGILQSVDAETISELQEKLVQVVPEEL